MKTCKRGHEREFLDKRCRLCHNIVATAYRKINPENAEKKRLRGYCWRKANPGKRNCEARAWRKANPEKARRAGNSWRKANPEKQTYFTNMWRKANPDKVNATNTRRKAAKLQRTPPWLTKQHFKEIQNFYTLAKELQWLSEQRLEVDHIVPLQGKNVSGLHVPWNLQILPRSLNASKNNKLLTNNIHI